MLDLSNVPGEPLTYNIEMLETSIQNSFTKDQIVSLCEEFDFGELTQIYTLMATRIQEAGYTFVSLDNINRVLEENHIAFRYDVHVHDIIPAYKLALLHEHLKIPAVFYLTWEFSGEEKRISHCFELFRLFDENYIQLGLHSAPASTWIIENKFKGNKFRARKMIESDELIKLSQSKNDINELFLNSCKTLENLSNSFRFKFGKWNTVTGHGNVISRFFYKRLKEEPNLASLNNLLNPVKFFQSINLEDYGFTTETTFIGKDISGSEVMIQDGSFRNENTLEIAIERLHSGTALAFTIHPRLCTCSPHQNFLNNFISRINSR